MDLDAALERLKRCELPTELEVEELTHRAREILVQEPNVLTLVSPITLVGDIHGQFYDLREMFSIGEAFQMYSTSSLGITSTGATSLSRHSFFSLHLR